jgi:hypothetical protein
MATLRKDKDMKTITGTNFAYRATAITDVGKLFVPAWKAATSNSEQEQVKGQAVAMLVGLYQLTPQEAVCAINGLETGLVLYRFS